jgi:hypothetical protein
VLIFDDFDELFGQCTCFDGHLHTVLPLDDHLVANFIESWQDKQRG